LSALSFIFTDSISRFAITERSPDFIFVFISIQEQTSTKTSADALPKAE